MAALITMTVQSFAAKLDLKSITRGEFRAESMASLKPLDDGESYSQVSSDGTQILKYSFKTGSEYSYRPTLAISTAGRSLQPIIFMRFRTIRWDLSPLAANNRLRYSRPTAT